MSHLKTKITDVFSERREWVRIQVASVYCAPVLAHSWSCTVPHYLRTAARSLCRSTCTQLMVHCAALLAQICNPVCRSTCTQLKSSVPQHLHTAEIHCAAVIAHSWRCTVPHYLRTAARSLCRSTCTQLIVHCAAILAHSCNSLCRSTCTHLIVHCAAVLAHNCPFTVPQYLHKAATLPYTVWCVSVFSVRSATTYTNFTFVYVDFTKFGCDLQENTKTYVRAPSVCCLNGRKLKHITGDSKERNVTDVSFVVPVHCLVLRWWSGQCVRNVAPPWSLTLQSTVVTICTTSLPSSNSTFCPHSVFVCFVWISEQTAIVSLYNIKWLVCITER